MLCRDFCVLYDKGENGPARFARYPDESSFKTNPASYKGIYIEEITRVKPGGQDDVTGFVVVSREGYYGYFKADSPKQRKSWLKQLTAAIAREQTTDVNKDIRPELQRIESVEEQETSFSNSKNHCLTPNITTNLSLDQAVCRNVELEKGYRCISM